VESSERVTRSTSFSVTNREVPCAVTKGTRRQTAEVGVGRVRHTTCVPKVFLKYRPHCAKVLL